MKHLFLVPEAQSFGRAPCSAPVSPYFQSTHPDSIEIFLKTQTCYSLFRQKVNLHLAEASEAFHLFPDSSLMLGLSSLCPESHLPHFGLLKPHLFLKSTCVPTAAQWMGSAPGSTIHLLCGPGQGTRLH